MVRLCSAWPPSRPLLLRVACPTASSPRRCGQAGRGGVVCLPFFGGFCGCLWRVLSFFGGFFGRLWGAFPVFASCLLLGFVLYFCCGLVRLVRFPARPFFWLLVVFCWAFRRRRWLFLVVSCGSFFCSFSCLFGFSLWWFVVGGFSAFVSLFLRLCAGLPLPLGWRGWPLCSSLVGAAWCGRCGSGRGFCFGAVWLVVVSSASWRWLSGCGGGWASGFCAVAGGGGVGALWLVGRFLGLLASLVRGGFPALRSPAAVGWRRRPRPLACRCWLAAPVAQIRRRGRGLVAPLWSSRWLAVGGVRLWRGRCGSCGRWLRPRRPCWSLFPLGRVLLLFGRRRLGSLVGRGRGRRWPWPWGWAFRRSFFFRPGCVRRRGSPAAFAAACWLVRGRWLRPLVSCRCFSFLAKRPLIGRLVRACRLTTDEPGTTRPSQEKSLSVWLDAVRLVWKFSDEMKPNNMQLWPSV